MVYKCIMGVDPGISGAIAIYYPEHPYQIACYDMPLNEHGVDGYVLSKIIRQFSPDVAFVEKVSSRPKQGVVSVFTFGEAYGVAKGVLFAVGIKIELVAPRVWKRELELSSDKNESLDMARMLWPASEHFKRKKDNGRAEASLIAFYGFKSQFNATS